MQEEDAERIAKEKMRASSLVERASRGRGRKRSGEYLKIRKERGLDYMFEAVCRSLDSIIYRNITILFYYIILV